MSRGRRLGGMNSRGYPARVLDALETDGGWLTVDGIQLVVGGRTDTLRRALERLKHRGMVERRLVEMAHADPGTGDGPFRGRGQGSVNTIDKRSEWRTV